MHINGETRLLDKVKIIPIVILIVFFVISTVFTINNNQKLLEYETTHLKEDFVSFHKKLVKHEVEKVYNLVNHHYENDFLSTTLNEQELKNHIIEVIKSLRYNENGYIFVLNYKGNFLCTIDYNKVTREKVNNVDFISKELKEQIIQKAKDGSGYISYVGIPNSKGKNTLKISYIKGFEPYSWAIGYGFHPKDIEPKIEEQIKRLEESHNQQVAKIVLLNMILLITLSALLILFSNNIKKIFTKYKADILNQEIKNRKLDEIIFYQSKMASIGELLNMISHQWRQPLSQINALTLDIFLEQKSGKLDEKQVLDNLKSIEDTTKYLSQTIDDFSKFFIKEKNKNFFLPNLAVIECLKILSPSLKNVNIDVKNESEKRLFGFITLFQQVIVSIITNSLDAFNERDIKNPEINISIYDKYNYVYMDIQDNAGGIDKKHIDNIFKLYFSTKTKKTSNGLGLYIAKQIIEKNMDGNIKAVNNNEGVKFTIKMKTNESK